jgi:hypothetical protein
MKTLMNLDVEAKCPVDGETIKLAVTVDCGNETLMVEDLLATIAELVKQPIIQENFTRLLSHRLDMRVKTIGTHSGVTITCEA